MHTHTQPLCGGAADGDAHSNRDPTTGRRLAFAADACASVLCPILVMAQLLRHLFDFRGRWDARWPLRPADVEQLV